MKYVNQLDYAHIPYITRTSYEGEAYEKGQKTTVRSSGCGLCSAIMVGDRLLPDFSFTPEEAVQFSYDVGANQKNGTSYRIFAPAFAEKFGLKHEGTNDAQRLIECLKTGGAAVAHSGGDGENYVGTFSHGGHYVAVISVEPDGRLAVLDPSYKEGKYEEEGRGGKVEMKNGVIALCDVEVLKKDCSTRNPSFHLFWRA